VSDTKPAPPVIAPGRAGNAERAIVRAAVTVCGLVPQVDVALARAAIVSVASQTKSRNMITEYLVAHPAALVDGDSGAPDPVARLIGELIAAGVDGLALPRCLDCGEPKPLRRHVPGGRVCNRCLFRRRPLETCASCGTIARRAKRDADSNPICARCNRLTYVPTVHRCGVCGVNRTYRTKKRICRECAELPHTSCAACGLPAAIPTDGTDPRCSHCVTGTTEPCRECGELTAGRDRKGRARCERCYRRPVGTCGRCGRVRAIVRLAIDGDPDLCAICWTGPTATCESCGKVRPCRGERRGRMLCGTCTPVRPQTCAHCARRRRPTAQWPEGPVCRACYDRALNAKGSCPRCGEQRRLMRYDGGETAICRECAGVPEHHVCGRCGDETAPYWRGLCARCVTSDRLIDLLGDEDARRARGLDGLFELLLSVRSLKDRPRWLARSPVVPLLAELGRGELEISHDALDQHPSRQAARRLEDLLVAAGALAARDPALARMEEWIEQHIAGSDHEPVLRPFAHWIVLRRYRRKSRHTLLNFGELSHAKTELVSATAFLDWLTDRGHQLGECAQADIDAWLAGPGAGHYIARRVARRATAPKLMPRLEFPTGHRGGPTPPITQHHPGTLARRLLEDPSIPARERVAAILIAVYAQPLVRVARFTIDKITVSDSTMTIQFAQTPVTLPDPVAIAVRVWLDQRHATMPPLATPSPWLFPGNPPSRPISEQSFSRRLKQIGVDCRHDRRAALLHLAGEIPAAILSDIVGIHVNTAGNWADMAGRPWGDYPSLREGPGRPR
jgi:hypothetical protein